MKGQSKIASKIRFDKGQTALTLNADVPARAENFS
jgi:hypothetical protein